MAWAAYALEILLAMTCLADAARAFELQGHRGARGMMPENTLPAFAKALSIGVSTLELDVGITKDGIVVVAHDSKLNPSITRATDGRWLADWGPSLRQLTWAKLEKYDVGRIDPTSRYAIRFPRQVPVDGTSIPSLAQVLALARRAGNERVRFNVETKVNPLEPSLTLAPEPFVRAVVGVLREEGMIDRSTIQSFDWRTLKWTQRLAPGVVTAYLSAQQPWLDNIQKGRPGPSPWSAGLDVDDFGGSVARMVAAAGGRVWSPYHREVDAARLREARELGLDIIVWTVNDEARMGALIDLGVDGIITDYPDRLRRVLEDRRMETPSPTAVEP